MPAAAWFTTDAVYFVFLWPYPESTKRYYSEMTPATFWLELGITMLKSFAVAFLSILFSRRRNEEPWVAALFWSGIGIVVDTLDLVNLVRRFPVGSAEFLYAMLPIGAKWLIVGSAVGLAYWYAMRLPRRPRWRRR